MLRFTYIYVAFSLICGELGESKYTARVGDERHTWLNLKHTCESSSGYLASITTADELAAVLEYMNDFPVGFYAIGLSLQAGYDRHVDGNWKWETGEAFDSSIITWGPSQPDGGTSKFLGVRVKIDDGYKGLYDLTATTRIIDRYICEFDLPIYFQSVENRGVTRPMDASYMRCAMRCRRQTECQGFHIDDAGCQLEDGVNDDNKRQYSKITYPRSE
ncbi:uncharacterized protein LOC117113185 [Anneissia japonica]|uniref:uncharacterized protein LOC117113185 n=1 Tax=Anneissia japonica TaxID=1529436 RepID=UPI001425B321|nr:uncharacterized protein LOC117113185 [Anneissia japonica]XP_033112362.1 uncharacterized protein LOC117113185 [Anneissia japonica]